MNPEQSGPWSRDFRRQTRFAVWGYDNGFMETCRRELTIETGELRSSSIAVAEENGEIVGVAQIKVVGSEADLLKLFVEPTALRAGVGRTLFLWSMNEAKSKGAERLVIEADPDAAPFYKRMGAEDCELAPSGSIPERILQKQGATIDLSAPMLPLLAHGRTAFAIPARSAFRAWPERTPITAPAPSPGAPGSSA